MKIGILTHHYVKNFGAFMQAFALIKVIQEYNPDIQVELIDYRITKHAILTSAHFLGFKFKRGDTVFGFIGKIGLLFKHAKYERTLPRSKRVRSANEINDLKYDLIIIGSDEVWNFKDIAYDPLKFGQGIMAPLITYSASVGGSCKEDSLPIAAKKGMSKFKAIAARDDKTAELVKFAIGFDAERTLDPIFLYDYEFAENRRIHKITSMPYLLIYDCNLSKKQTQIVVAFSKQNGLKIVGAGEYRKWYDYHTTTITPFDWAYLFKNAWGVITGTFHGVSFSIKYNRRFVAFLTDKNRINKVRSLLKEFDLEEQIIYSEQEDQIVVALQRHIDYVYVEQIMKRQITKSKIYLYSEINKI